VLQLFNANSNHRVTSCSEQLSHKSSIAVFAVVQQVGNPRRTAAELVCTVVLTCLRVWSTRATTWAAK